MWPPEHRATVGAIKTQWECQDPDVAMEVCSVSSTCLLPETLQSGAASTKAPEEKTRSIQQGARVVQTVRNEVRGRAG